MITDDPEKKSGAEANNRSMNIEEQQMVVKHEGVKTSAKPSITQTISQDGIVQNFQLQVSSIHMNKLQSAKTPVPRLMSIDHATLFGKETKKSPTELQIKREK